ncbi:hypothetical protein JTE90_008414 [Oedothorax gibbosus]|uniref:Uncharacterized protein n=1 Tax=Oedothorax gibbosus TaxID=931172 RepID=A0AAV6V4R8_9ARAC|nr:hypothetical protein JTE90_008414 [Oedothorax gibbosus]
MRAGNHFVQDFMCFSGHLNPLFTPVLHHVLAILQFPDARLCPRQGSSSDNALEGCLQQMGQDRLGDRRTSSY